MKQILTYTVTFLVLLVGMTFFGYKQELKKLEAMKQKAIEDSLRTLDSLAQAREDSLRLAREDSLKKLESESEPLQESQQVGYTESNETEEEPINYKEVAKIYEKMTPDVAAKILNQFSPEEASGILLNMKKRQAAKIISSLEPSLAAEISKLMLKQKKN